MRQKPGLTYLNLAHFLDHYFLLIFPTAVIAIERDWGLDYGAALVMGTPMYLTLALATIPAGWLGDRVSRQWLIGFFFVGSGIASICTGMMSSPGELAISLSLLGACAAIYHPVGLAMVTEYTRRPGRTLAINGVYGNLGLAGAALATGLLADQFGWRSAFVIPGLVSTTVGITYLISIHRTGHRQTTERQAAKIASIAHNRRAQIRVMVFVITAALFGGAVFNAITVSLPKLFDERLMARGVDLSELGVYVAMVFAVAAFAQLPVGNLLDRFGARILLIVLLPIQIASLVIISSTDGPWVIPLAMLLVLMLFAEIPITGWLIGQYVTTNWRARAFSVEYMLSLGVGAAIVPTIALGYKVGIGFDRQYLGLAAASFIVLLSALSLPAWYGRVKHPQYSVSGSKL